MKTAAEIIETNKKQRAFYNDIRQNFATRMWAGIRNGLLNRIRKDLGIQDRVYEQHQAWFGDLSQKKVLDLGCYAGNYLSLYLAKHARSYTGIDLSDVAIARLSERLKDFPNAKAVAIDFLSEEFAEGDFDLIYAYGVLHHFPNVPLLIGQLQKKMAEGGEIISYDPLQTSLPIRIIRALYRPFQSDAEWEWPFTTKTVSEFEAHFDVLERRGILGKAKWMAVVNFIPVPSRTRAAYALRWNQFDWENSAHSDKALFACMHMTMRMRKKQRAGQ